MIERSRIKLALYTLGGIFAGGITLILAEIVLYIYRPGYSVDYSRMMGEQASISAVFAALYLANLPMRFAPNRKYEKVMIKHMTFVNSMTSGYFGNAFMLMNLPPECNAIPVQFWFTFGLIFFYAASANLFNIASYGLIYLASLLYTMSEVGDFSFDEKIVLLSIGFQIACFSPLASMAANKMTALKHAIRQLEKVFYPHQIIQIKKGIDLESTMPTTTRDACVICLDIIGSSKLQHVHTKVFLQNFFRSCNEKMMQGYDSEVMSSKGYRIKEMGDGFLCSVGYPFQAASRNVAESAVELARDFHQILLKEAQILELDQGIRCGIGIALDQVAGFYPQSGTREYDLHGRAILMATRYQTIRNLFLGDDAEASYIILQERVHSSLGRGMRAEFEEYSLSDLNYKIRDDAAADKVFVQRLYPALHEAAASKLVV